MEALKVLLAFLDCSLLITSFQVKMKCFNQREPLRGNDHLPD